MTTFNQLKKQSTIALIKMDRNPETPTHEREWGRQIVFKRFERYVFKFAHQYRNNSPLITFDHLVSAGREALAEAFDDFDISKGTYFSTWAYNKVKFGIWHSLKEDKVIPKYYKALNDSNGGDDDREFDIPDKVELEEKNRFALTYGEKTRLQEIILDILGDHEDKYEVVVARFGLSGGQPMSNKECVETFGFSPSKVSACVRYFRKRALTKYGEELKEMYVK